VVGFTAGEIPKLPLYPVPLKSCDVGGVFWGSWTRKSSVTAKVPFQDTEWISMILPIGPLEMHGS
jgi:NADPH2:quinone reductase